MISDLVHITGELNTTESITATLSGRERITSEVSLPDVVGGRHYEGDYDVIPKFDSQTLQTRGYLMDDDVTVEAIQVSRTSNPSGGKTVYIGGLINGE